MISRIVALGVLFFCGSAASGQQFSTVRSQTAVWKCHGWVWLSNSNLYCGDAKTHELSKFGASGQQAFSRLERPTSGKQYPVVALDEDATHTVYAVDGVNIHVYSPDGTYERTLTPGVGLSGGIAVLDPNHIFVTGRVPPPRGNSTATVFLVGPNGIERAFSDVFIHGLSGLDDKILNFEAHLALDRSQKLLYQVSQNVYEIRVFDLDGKQLRVIVPPAQYAIKTSRLTHVGNAAGLDPGDSIQDMAMLPGGGLAVDGVLLDSAQSEGNKTSVSYSRFVDVFGPDGSFRHRFTGTELQLNGTYFAGFDHATGNAFFKNDNIVVEAQVR